MKKQNILLVEDYHPNILVVTLFLQELGYAYDVAGSGKEALDKFSHTDYDAVIMDVQMPDMDGIETVRRMRALEKEKSWTPTPVIAVTGNAMGEDRASCLKAGMNDYLSKPFRLKDLEDKLQSYISDCEAS